LDEYIHYNLEPTVFGVFGVVGWADDQPLRNASADVDLETFNAAPEGTVA
jgi:hypothetical protein